MRDETPNVAGWLGGYWYCYGRHLPRQAVASLFERHSGCRGFKRYALSRIAQWIPRLWTEHWDKYSSLRRHLIR